MNNIQAFITYLIFIISASISTSATASIIRMEFMFGNTPSGDIYIELFDQDTPATVSNFLNYIQDNAGERRYDGTFIHRSVANFVLQGGGYKYDPASGEFGTLSAPHILEDSPVKNEFDVSRPNIRGTIAMAKKGVDINGVPSEDSATSEWFFNLKDNPGLNTQNEGFTIFGKVLGTGMDFIDSIASLPVVNAGSSTFSELPVSNHTLATPVTQQNLVTIKPSVFLSGFPVEFGTVDVFTASETKSLIIQNSNTADLLIGQFDLSSVQLPFSAVDNCSGQILAPSENCTIDIIFSPADAGDFSATITAPVNSVSTPIAITIDASAVFSTAKITLPDDVPVIIDDARHNVPTLGNFSIRNDGTSDLQITAYNFTGPDANLFTIADDCKIIAVNTDCIEFITFLATAVGEYTAILEISSNDPDAQVTTIAVTASASEDNDGIKDSIEMAAPNGGDNNRDGIPDHQQENVASFPDINGQYISLVTDQSILLTGVKAIENPSPTGLLPIDNNSIITFPYGFFQFKLENLPVDGTASATIYLPENDQLPAFTTYYKYLPSTFRPPFFFTQEAWFSFDIRTNPSAGIGAEFNGNTVILHFIDGAAGDADNNINGTIVDPGGIAFITPTIAPFTEQSSGGCTMQGNTSAVTKHIEWLIILCCFLLYRWFYIKPRQDEDIARLAS